MESFLLERYVNGGWFVMTAYTTRKAADVGFQNEQDVHPARIMRQITVHGYYNGDRNVREVALAGEK